jgi:hypothetical protein
MFHYARYILLVFLAVIGIVSCGWFNSHTEETQIKYDLGLLNSALFKYQEEQHTIPQSLDQLIPGYISEIPDEPWGGEYCITNYVIATSANSAATATVVIAPGYTRIPNLRHITNAAYNTTLHDRKLKEAAESFGLEYPVYISSTEWMFYGDKGKHERITVTLGDLNRRSCTFTSDTNGIRLVSASTGSITIKRLPPIEALSLLLNDCIRNHTRFPGGPVKCSRADYPVVKKTAYKL